jgi:hypothetical protein
MLELQAANPLSGNGQLPDALRRAVGAAVVDQDDLERSHDRFQIIGELVDERLEIVPFVADGDDDGEVHGGAVP